MILCLLLCVACLAPMAFWRSKMTLTIGLAAPWIFLVITWLFASIFPLIQNVGDSYGWTFVILQIITAILAGYSILSVVLYQIIRRFTPNI